MRVIWSAFAGSEAMSILLGSGLIVLILMPTIGQTPVICPTSANEASLSDENLRTLIEGGVPLIPLRRYVQQCGLAIRVPDNSTLEQRLRELGAPAALLSDLRPPDGAAPGTSWSSPGDRREMIFVPGGTFWMGSL